MKRKLLALLAGCMIISANTTVTATDYSTPYAYYDANGDVWYWTGSEHVFIGYGEYVGITGISYYFKDTWTQSQTEQTESSISYAWENEEGEVWCWDGTEDHYIGTTDEYYVDENGGYYPVEESEAETEGESEAETKKDGEAEETTAEVTEVSTETTTEAATEASIEITTEEVPEASAETEAEEETEPEEVTEASTETTTEEVTETAAETMTGEETENINTEYEPADGMLMLSGPDYASMLTEKSEIREDGTYYYELHSADEETIIYNTCVTHTDRDQMDEYDYCQGKLKVINENFPEYPLRYQDDELTEKLGCPVYYFSWDSDEVEGKISRALVVLTEDYVYLYQVTTIGSASNSIDGFANNAFSKIELTEFQMKEETAMEVGAEEARVVLTGPVPYRMRPLSTVNSANGEYSYTTVDEDGAISVNNVCKLNSLGEGEDIEQYICDQINAVNGYESYDISIEQSEELTEHMGYPVYLASSGDGYSANYNVIFFMMTDTHTYVYQVCDHYGYFEDFFAEALRIFSTLKLIEY